MFQILRELRDLQWTSPSELRSRQTGHLRTALIRAYEHVPLYRQRWDVSATRLREEDPWTVLESLPVLEKSDLQKRSEELLSDEPPGRVSRKTTGGSTGEPVTVVKDRRAIAYERATSWLGYSWFGLQIGDRGARFWGSPEEIGRRRLRYAAADMAMNRIRFSAFAFSDEELQSYWKKCLRERPDYFYGYVSMLTEFARFVRDQGYDREKLNLKVVITTSEALSEPQRDLLETVFCAPVQDEYGCGELGPIAYQCPSGRLHIMTENVAVEVLREDGTAVDPGDAGEVVVTDLNNRAMPLIRYRVGDRAVLGEECDCGRSFPVLEGVQGRAYDFVENSLGERFHGEYFMYLFEDLRDRGAEIDRFRVTQESELDLVLEVVSSAALSPRHEAMIRDRITRDMPEMEVSISYRKELERAPSGKTRVIRNRVADREGSDPRS